MSGTGMNDWFNEKSAIDGVSKGQYFTAYMNEIGGNLSALSMNKPYKSTLSNTVGNLSDRALNRQLLGLKIKQQTAFSDWYENQQPGSQQGGIQPQPSAIDPNAPEDIRPMPLQQAQAGPAAQAAPAVSKFGFEQPQAAQPVSAISPRQQSIDAKTLLNPYGDPYTAKQRAAIFNGPPTQAAFQKRRSTVNNAIVQGQVSPNNVMKSAAFLFPNSPEKQQAFVAFDAMPKGQARNRLAAQLGLTDDPLGRYTQKTTQQAPAAQQQIQPLPPATRPVQQQVQPAPAQQRFNVVGTAPGQIIQGQPVQTGPAVPVQPAPTAVSPAAGQPAPAQAGQPTQAGQVAQAQAPTVGSAPPATAMDAEAQEILRQRAENTPQGMEPRQVMPSYTQGTYGPEWRLATMKERAQIEEEGVPTIPPGFVAVKNDSTGQVSSRPALFDPRNPNNLSGEAKNKARKARNSIVSVLKIFDKMERMVEDEGFMFVTDAIWKEWKGLISGASLDLAQLNNLGVLQKADKETLEETMPKPGVPAMWPFNAPEKEMSEVGETLWTTGRAAGETLKDIFGSKEKHTMAVEAARVLANHKDRLFRQYLAAGGRIDDIPLEHIPDSLIPEFYKPLEINVPLNTSPTP